MPEVVGVKFDFNTKVYYFSPGELELAAGDAVVVQTSAGIDYGTVAAPRMQIDDDKVTGELKPVLRRATAEDEDRHARLLQKREEIYPEVQRMIRESGLDMKFSGAEYTFDGAKLLIYFTAENRVDFRQLVRELASTFHTRIELRQIGARDECRKMGGIAPCGRPCCCADHMDDYAHVSIKMAKTQNLSLNPEKISGLCGRLMCCLSYENEHYAEVQKLMPKIGSAVTLPDGRVGVANATNPLKQTVRVKIENAEKGTVEFSEFPLGELTFKKAPPQPQNENKGNDGKNQNNGGGKNQNGGGKKKNKFKNKNRTGAPQNEPQGEPQA